MEHTRDKKGSLKNASNAAKKQQREKEKEQQLIKKVNHVGSWLIGVLFPFVPLIVCGSGSLLHKDNASMVDNYAIFYSDFFSSGSFLWISITVLVMSLSELLLYGFRKSLSGWKFIGSKIFVFFALLFVFWGMWIYQDNVGNPIEVKMMYIISSIAFVFFTVFSGIISFKIVKEA